MEIISYAEVMISINFVGAWAMLAGVNDFSKAPTEHLAATAAGIDPDMFSPDYRLQPALLAQRLAGGVTGFKIDLPLATAPVRDHVKRLEVRADGRASIAGYAHRIQTLAQSSQTGAATPGQLCEVDCSFKRTPGRPGYEIGLLRAFPLRYP